MGADTSQDCSPVAASKPSAWQPVGVVPRHASYVRWSPASLAEKRAQLPTSRAGPTVEARLTSPPVGGEATTWSVAAAAVEHRSSNEPATAPHARTLKTCDPGASWSVCTSVDSLLPAGLY